MLRAEAVCDFAAPPNSSLEVESAVAEGTHETSPGFGPFRASDGWCDSMWLWLWCDPMWLKWTKQTFWTWIRLATTTAIDCFFSFFEFWCILWSLFFVVLSILLLIIPSLLVLKTLLVLLSRFILLIVIVLLFRIGLLGLLILLSLHILHIIIFIIMSNFEWWILLLK